MTPMPAAAPPDAAGSTTDAHALWPALAAAHAQTPDSRIPFWVETGASRSTAKPVRVPAGSVARQHLPLLARWPEALRVDAQGVHLRLPTADARSAFLAQANAWLRQQGAIRAWRNETYGLLALPAQGLPPDPRRDTLATLERASARFWGSATFGAHANGYVAAANGRPSHLWVARRADDKPTDPGLLDNLIGGGVPHGQSPREAVLREGWEEAGLRPAEMTGLQPGRVLYLARDVAEGFQREWLHVFDLALPAGLQPCNQDGEVQSLQCLSVDQAIALARQGAMTVDAALATLDFALRHRLLPPSEAAQLAPALAQWVRGPAGGTTTAEGLV